jgi:nucleoside-diphosphate-sugar epimerase
VESSVFSGCEAILHLAYAKYSILNKNASEINYQGTQKLLAAAIEAGITYFVYFSSQSAHKSAASEYGKSKYRIESQFNLNQHLIIRPGLVVGSGGVYEKMKEYIFSHTYIPLLNGGRQPIQTIHVSQLALATVELMKRRVYGRFNVSEPPGPTLRNLYYEIASLSGKKKIFFYVPLWFAKIAFRSVTHIRAAWSLIVSLLRIPALSWLKKSNIDFDMENLKGLEHLEPARTDNLKGLLSFEIYDYKKNIRLG